MILQPTEPSQSGTAVDALADTITLAADATDPTGQVIVLTGGTGEGQERTVLDYAVATNLLTYSEQFDNAAWVKDGGTITANAGIGVRGGVTADLFTATGGNRRVYQTNIITNGLEHTSTIRLKKQTGSAVRFSLINIADSTTNFDFDTEILTRAAPFTAHSVRIVENGYYEIALTWTATVGNAGVAVNLYNDADAVLLDMAQLEQASAVGPYVATTTASATGKVATVDRNWSASYLDLPGSAGNYASTPDSAAVSITGDIDIRVKVALDDWTPAGVNMVLIAKAGASQRSFILWISSAGNVVLFLYEDGATPVSATSSAATGVTDGQPKHIRATWRQSDGRVQFFLSDDEETWSQLGTDRSIAVASIFDGNSVVSVGAYNGGASSPLAGKIYTAEIRNGIDGEVVARFDASDAYFGDASVTSATTGEVWTINQSGAIPAILAGLPDTTTTYEIEDRIELLPEYSIVREQRRIEDKSRSSSGVLTRYNWGSYKRIELEDTNVSSYTASRINTWWSDGTPITITNSAELSVTSVYIVNDKIPCGVVSEPYFDEFSATLELETF